MEKYSPSINSALMRPNAKRGLVILVVHPSQSRGRAKDGGEQYTMTNAVPWDVGG